MFDFKLRGNASYKARRCRLATIPQDEDTVNGTVHIRSIILRLLLSCPTYIILRTSRLHQPGL